MKLLRPKDAATALGITKVSLWRWTKAPDFPKPYQIGRKAIAYDEGELRTWVESRRVPTA